MEEIFNNLLKDYSLAMEHYNRGEYTFYFRNIRPALEWLCKFVIADQLDEKCNPSDIFCGSKILRRAGGDYMIQLGNGKGPKGRQLTELMLSSFLFKRKDVREAKLDERLKGLRESMEMFCNCIQRFYSVASSGNHSSVPSDLIKHDATKYASILSDFISFLINDEILNKNNRENLAGLELTRIVDANEIESLHSEKRLISEQYIKQKQELEAALKRIEEYKS